MSDETTFLGRTGVRVSRLAMGTMSFGGDADEGTASAMFHRCREAGINVFDCADVYERGRSEVILGKLVASERDEIVLASKAYFPTGSGPNARGTSRYHLVRAVEASLTRLGTDRLDLFYLHRWDDDAAIDTVLAARPEIFNHNLETIRRLTPEVRSVATYERSLSVLAKVKNRALEIFTKSGLMLGLGETEAELHEALRDLRAVDCDLLTLGQYLQPTPSHAPIDRWAPPEEFDAWKEFALSVGIGVVESGPLVRSSYHAEEQSERFGVAQAASA